ncbi:MAG: FAD-binding oxidoreductase [Candidatus Acidiferrales bacterium]
MSTAGATVGSRLADIVGPQHVITDPALLAAFAVDDKKPAVAVRPQSTAEIAEIVKFAANEKLAVIASGARTKLGIGLPPRQYDIALDMTRLDHVVAYDPGDLTLSVEAGIPLRTLGGILAEHRQFLPLGVPYQSQTTIGGTIASGVDSPLRQLYGTARDYLLGMEFVTGEGVASKSGGRVVKNVTGYDIHKLMIGALGTLGVITRVNFKTFPMPAASRAFVASFQTVERACGMRNRLSQSPLAPMTVELFSPGVADLFSSEAPSRIEPNPMPENVLSGSRWSFTTGFAGNENALKRYETDLRKIAEECGAVDVVVLGSSQIGPAFARKREFVPIALSASPATTILKICVVPMKISEALKAAAQAAETNHLPWVAMARGVGVIYFALLPTERNDETKRQSALASNQIFAACAELGGHATIPWCPAEWKDVLKVWGLDRPDFAQMQKLKMVFDPLAVLSPGRFVGGI